MKAPSSPSEQPPAGARTRNPERSRAAVLDAAERLFAERGFAAATMQEIGEAAGLSRGAPAYIFGSKRELYRAVIERVFEDRHRALAPAFDAVSATSTGELAPAALEQALLPGISAYLEFLADRPAFVRLLQWEALHGGEGLRSIPHRSSAIDDAIAELANAERGAFSIAETRQLVLSCVALCFFPFEHASTMLPGLGLDPADPSFRRERASHVASLLAAAIAQAREEQP